MKVDFQRKVDRIGGRLICRILSLLPHRGRDKHSAFPRNILVILLSEMGSLVLAQPMLRNIRKKYPDASSYILVLKQNKEVLDVVGTIPEANILTVSNLSLRVFATDSIRIWRTMRRLRIDTVIDCELFSRISSIYSWLSGATVRVGFHPYNQEGLFRGHFINRPVLYNPYQHIGHQFITLAEAIGDTGHPNVKRQIERDDLSLTPMETDDVAIKAMKDRLQRDFPHIHGKKLVLLNPSGGLLPIRAWPLENFAGLSRDLVRKGYAVGITGMARDKSLAQEIRSLCGSDNCIDLTGYTSTVRELMLLFHLACLLITNDGGPSHFAPMTPVPCITFFGPETPALYGPLGDKSFTFFSNLACSPCLTAYNHRNSPCDGDNRCLRSIDPETVLLKTYEILSMP